MSYIRSRYWIIRVKNQVKAYVHNCIICAKLRAINRQQIMGDLPKVRVTPARPFLHSGVDFAGPLQILSNRGRGAKCVKSYISILICMATKAVHLELVSDMSSQAFIAAFERFIARRGKCSHIWSDQGTNFIGANKELHDLWKQSQFNLPDHLKDIFANDGVQWHFYPPYSPNFGGLWEAGVKSIKFHLKRILDKNLTFEELTTTLCKIEACLNSRPLCPIDSSNTDDVEVLTPGHFLIGEAPITVPNPDIGHININRLSHWQHTQRLVQNFWHRWQCEYLTRLQERPKWQRVNREFKIGEIVLIKDESLPPGKMVIRSYCCNI